MTVCVHGLGYVGLATAALFANEGHDVVGYDTDPDVLEALRQGEPAVAEDELDRFVRSALSGGLSVSDEAVAADYHMVCVPTPYDDGVDLRYVVEAATTVASLVRPGDAVVVESTVSPGTTTRTVGPLLERSGLAAGEDVSLAYAPETILPGNTVAELRTNDRIVGGVDDESAATVKNLYAPAVTGDVHVVSDATTAEFVKLAQNAFRDVNIAFANELALIADDCGVDVREAIEFANTHPRVDILNPGPGVGGHCLPVDPLFLADSSGSSTLIECAREVNDSMADHLVARLRGALGSLEDRDVTVLGVAYKGNVAETRNSPGLAFARALEAATVASAPVADGGTERTGVRLSDPHVSGESFDLFPLSEALDGADAAVVTAAHDEYADLDPARVADLLRTPLVVDAVDVLDAPAWREHGVDVVEL